MNKIKSFEEACEKLGRSTELPDVSSFPEKLQKPMIALYKLTVIHEAMNLRDGEDPWKPDWTDYNQRKYFPYFTVENTGSGLVCASYGWTATNTATAIGSRLCFSSSKLAEYAGKQFIDLYNDVLILK